MKKIKEIKYLENAKMIKIIYTDYDYECVTILSYEKFKHYTLYELEYYVNKECL